MSLFSSRERETIYSTEESAFDWLLFLSILLIVALGILNIYSATSREAGLGSDLVMRQIFFALGGFSLIGLLMLFDYRFVERVSYILYGMNIFFLMLVPFFGVFRSGAKRWLDFGFVSFQPSETMKFLLILALAKYFQNREHDEALGFRALFIPALLITVPTLLIMSQPDLGTGGHLAIVGAIMLLFVGINKRVFLTLCMVAVVSLPIAWEYGLKPYQKDRVMTFLNPKRDPQGKGFNALQSMIAVGSGQFAGKGFQKGTQTQLDFTPEKHTDFIFTVLAEEWGFLGAIFLFILYLGLFQRCLRISSMAKDKFGALLGVGVIGMFVSQIFINVAMACGMFPIVGLPLPLVSYGGTSMITTCIALGLLLNVGYKRNIF